MIAERRLVVVARDNIQQSGTASAANVCVLVSASRVPLGHYWRVTNLSVASGSTVLTPSAAIYLKADTERYSDIDGRDYAYLSAQRNASNYASPLIARQGEYLIVRFTNADSGSICVFNAEVEICREQEVVIPSRIDGDGGGEARAPGVSSERLADGRIVVSVREQNGNVWREVVDA